MSRLSEWMLVNPDIINKMEELRVKYGIDSFNNLLIFLMKQPVKKNIFGNPLVRAKLTKTMVKLLILFMDFEKLDVGSIITVEERKKMAQHIGWCSDTLRINLNKLEADGYLSSTRKGSQKTYHVMEPITPTVFMKYGGSYI